MDDFYIKQTNQGWSDAIDVHVFAVQLDTQAIGILIKNTRWQCRYDGYEFLRYNKASKNKQTNTSTVVHLFHSCDCSRSQQRSTMKGRKKNNRWKKYLNREPKPKIHSVGSNSLFFRFCWCLWIITRLFNVCQNATIK